MADTLKSLYGFPGPDELPTVDECQEVADAFLPLAAEGYWVPPQTATPAAAPSDSGRGEA